MTDRPIIFSRPMVRALIEGRKTQTRRLAWRAWKEVDDLSSERQEHFDALGHVFHFRSDGSVRAHAAPSPWQRVKPGDRLWVRESFNHAAGEGIAYMATNPHMNGAPWRPSIHMPRWASRLTLVPTEVRFQKLQEISEQDAIAEGAERRDEAGREPWHMAWSDQPAIAERYGLSTARWAFGNFFIRLHGERVWEENPQIVALTFAVHRCNIDALERAAP